MIIAASLDVARLAAESLELRLSQYLVPTEWALNHKLLKANGNSPAEVVFPSHAPLSGWPIQRIPDTEGRTCPEQTSTAMAGTTSSGRTSKAASSRIGSLNPTAAFSEMMPLGWTRGRLGTWLGSVTSTPTVEATRYGVKTMAMFTYP